MDYSIDKALYILKVMGNPAFDLEEFQKTEAYKGILQNMECFLRFTDDGCPEDLAYWAERGLQKELHEADDLGHKWASYLPIARQGAEPKQGYPLLFVLHGANNSIALAESYGYAHLAAREGVIVIMPENESETEMEKLFAYAREHYPVDWSRVYMVGFSLGGIMTARHCTRWPERFAAVGLGGMMFMRGAMASYWHNGAEWPGEEITEEKLARAAEYKIPVCVCMGEREMINLLPLNQGPYVPPPEKPLLDPDGHPTPFLDLSASAKIASVNNWRRISGGAQIPEETVQKLVAESQDVVTRMLGYPFDRTSVVKLGGLNHFIGDSLDKNGNVSARFVGIEKLPHWPNPDMPEIIWSFISQFSRNPRTGTLTRGERVMEVYK